MQQATQISSRWMQQFGLINLLGQALAGYRTMQRVFPIGVQTDGAIALHQKRFAGRNTERNVAHQLKAQHIGDGILNRIQPAPKPKIR